MRRLVAAVLACGLVASSTTASALHVHEYVDHDHPEHHHAPATHDHSHSTIADEGHHHAIPDGHPAIEAESCDPGRHAISISMGCAGVPQVHVEVAELPEPAVAAPSGPVRSALAVRDVRVHGPPFDARIPSRAPPLTPHA